MAKGSLDFTNVTFYYESAGEPIFQGLSCRFAGGWTGVIGPNGSGKTTLLHLACGQLAPTTGNVRRPGEVIYCRQRTDDPPDQLSDFLVATEPTACELRGRLAVETDWPGRWQTLSHGERKRAQIAVALWRQPEVLALDEPTNHIDILARQMLAEALKQFRGVGLLVSHDRELLDTLCRQCLFVEPPSAIMRPGGYTKATKLAAAENVRTKIERELARNRLRRLRVEAADRERAAARERRMRSKRGIPIKDHDARAKRNQARGGTGGPGRGKAKDGLAGKLLRQLDGRVKQAESRLASIRIRKDRKLGIDMQSAVSASDFLLRVDGGELALGSERKLVFGDLSMSPTDRVALIGPNGSGKSTLVRHILRELKLPRDRLVYMAQEITSRQSSQVLSAARKLPGVRLGEVMSVVSCLGCEPRRLLESDQPSPGEARKLLLALGIASRPYLIIMDEPTNHLDLPSIECLENALSQCPCGLLLVSHDMRFLKNLTGAHWEISPDPTDGSVCRLVAESKWPE